MFSHVTLGTNDRARAKSFWTAVTGALELPVLIGYPGGIAYGEATGKVERKRPIPHLPRPSGAGPSSP